VRRKAESEFRSLFQRKLKRVGEGIHGQVVGGKLRGEPGRFRIVSGRLKQAVERLNDFGRLSRSGECQGQVFHEALIGGGSPNVSLKFP
jgi:hypothetical protein